jgi:hypothetical protein
VTNFHLNNLLGTCLRLTKSQVCSRNDPVYFVHQVVHLNLPSVHAPYHSSIDLIALGHCLLYGCSTPRILFLVAAMTSNNGSCPDSPAICCTHLVIISFSRSQNGTTQMQHAAFDATVNVSFFADFAESMLDQRRRVHPAPILCQTGAKAAHRPP